MKKKICMFFMCTLIFTACSIPDTDCYFCDKDIASKDAYVVNDKFCCDACYSDANTCLYCDKMYINNQYADSHGFCDGCIENGNVILCEYCEDFFPKEFIHIEPTVNDCHLWNTCTDCFNDFISENCGTDYDDAWGKLIESNGGDGLQ